MLVKNVYRHTTRGSVFERFDDHASRLVVKTGKLDRVLSTADLVGQHRGQWISLAAMESTPAARVFSGVIGPVVHRDILRGQGLLAWRKRVRRNR